MSYNLNFMGYTKVTIDFFPVTHEYIYKLKLRFSNLLLIFAGLSLVAPERKSDPIRSVYVLGAVSCRQPYRYRPWELTSRPPPPQFNSQFTKSPEGSRTSAPAKS